MNTVTAVCSYCNNKSFSEWKTNSEQVVYNKCSNCGYWSEYNSETDTQDALPEPNKTTGDFV